MTEIKLYKCDFCSRAYDTQERAKSCEYSHEKNLKFSKFEYESHRKMPEYVTFESAGDTLKVTYHLIESHVIQARPRKAE